MWSEWSQHVAKVRVFDGSEAHVTCSWCQCKTKLATRLASLLLHVSLCRVNCQHSKLKSAGNGELTHLHSNGGSLVYGMTMTAVDSG